MALIIMLLSLSAHHRFVFTCPQSQRATFCFATGEKGRGNTGLENRKTCSVLGHEEAFDVVTRLKWMQQSLQLLNPMDQEDNGVMPPFSIFIFRVTRIKGWGGGTHFVVKSECLLFANDEARITATRRNVRIWWQSLKSVAKEIVKILESNYRIMRL